MAKNLQHQAKNRALFKGEEDGLPPFRIRRSKRASYLRVLVTPQEGVVVVLPNRAPKRLVMPFLHAHADWLWHEYQRANAARAGRERGELPTQIKLLAIKKEYATVYEPAKVARVACDEVASKLLVRGQIDRIGACCQQLRNWLKRQAATYLRERLEMLSERHRLPFNKSSIRLQKSRWGSCSAKATINLNAKLMFLAPELVDYVILHELAHTRYRNHSADFWHFLEDLAPTSTSLDRQLKQAGDIVPWWAEFTED